MEDTLKIILDKLNSMDSDIKDLKKHVVTIEDVKKHVIVIENEHGARLDSLMDGYKQIYEGQEEIKKDIKDIKETLNIHEIKLLKVR